MARLGEAVDLIANGPAEMHARLSLSLSLFRRRSSLLRVLRAGLEKVERPAGVKRNKTEMKEKRTGVGSRGRSGRGRAHAGKNPQEGKRDKQRQAGAVTRKAGVLNGIKQLST